MNFFLGYLLGKSQANSGGSGTVGSAGAGLVGLFLVGAGMVAIMGVFMPLYLAIHLGALAGGDRINPLFLILIIIGSLWFIWPFYMMAMFAPKRQSIIGLAVLVGITAFILATSSLTPGTPIDDVIGDAKGSDLWGLFAVLSLGVVAVLFAVRIACLNSLGADTCAAIYHKYTKSHRGAGGAFSRAMYNLGNSLGLWVILSGVFIALTSLWCVSALGDIADYQEEIARLIQSGKDMRRLEYRQESVRELEIGIAVSVFLCLLMSGNVVRIIARRRAQP